ITMTCELRTATDQMLANQQRIGVQIESLLDQVRTLRTQHNHWAPVSRLPPELLSLVFHHCVYSPADYPRCSPGGSGPATPSLPLSTRLFPFMEVCRHWRAVALNCAPLWSNVACIDASLTAELLSRSKDAPLDILAYGPYVAPTRLALSEVRRARRLQFLAV
ncbi:hypothetical protein PUNSTDRAFT_33014, partial [Punctularia strigosozonata HHB-11173 SS5]|uniref:uncharacterized protein n=1 Tax=Punctularia strigosozonata (strain HHB-11173) TaxID=741275 RepID=UPI00044166BB